LKYLGWAGRDLIAVSTGISNASQNRRPYPGRTLVAVCGVGMTASKESNYLNQINGLDSPDGAAKCRGAPTTLKQNIPILNTRIYAAFARFGSAQISGRCSWFKARQYATQNPQEGT
jgi:hypothetical protein